MVALQQAAAAMQKDRGPRLAAHLGDQEVHDQLIEVLLAELHRCKLALPVLFRDLPLGRRLDK